MTSISNFESDVYSEEIYSVSEQEFDEVMQMMADEQSGFEGYGEWSAELEQTLSHHRVTATALNLLTNLSN
jgi:hypothetical protein